MKICAIYININPHQLRLSWYSRSVTLELLLCVIHVCISIKHFETSTLIMQMFSCEALAICLPSCSVICMSWWLANCIDITEEDGSTQ